MTRNFCALCSWAIALGFVFYTAHTVSADVRLPGFYGNHMVLQQQQPLRFRGWADAGEQVTLQLGTESKTVKADAEGQWSLELSSREASKQPLRIIVRGANNSITLDDILIGEVWLCSGQSNMEWTVAASRDAQQEIAAANFPMIRHMKVSHRPANAPQSDITAEWQICSPETVANFTACGYFMARKIHQELDVPIGLINSSWGGTRIEPWSPLIGFQNVPALADIHQSVLGRTPGTESYRTTLQKHATDTEQWLVQAKKVLTSATPQSLEPLAANPAFPSSLVPFQSHQDPTMLYNGMIHALVGFPIRGAIWYQGESNHGEGLSYFEKKKALVEGWREVWQQGDFPFYFVQIAPYQYGNEAPEILAEFWEVQATCQQISNTAMVVINDIATLGDIHPPNKQDVGLRLAQLALQHDYGRVEVVAHSPELEAVEVLPGKLRIKFRNSGGGLKTRNGQAPSHFEVIGPGSMGFKPAVAIIDGDSVVLEAAGVAAPVAFRFAWHKLAEPNLTGATGLPVGACRGGKVPEFSELMPDFDKYQIVYDLDLNQLGPNFKYQVDNSQSIKSFDRIAYLLELQSTDRGEQKILVAMDAFTDSAGKIGIPTVASQASFAVDISNLEIFTNEAGLPNGAKRVKGNIEFWPNNYGAGNAQKVSGALGNAYDIGDEMSPPLDGYGCMQVHDTEAKQTLFAINHWKLGAQADVGIGNSSGQNKDWTFAANAGSYSQKRLRVYVRSK